MTFRDEFRWSMIRLDHDKASDFAKSPWVPWYIVAIYRIIFAVYCTCWILYGIISHDDNIWPVLLTNWGYTVVTIHFIFSSVVTLLYRYKEKKNSANITRTRDVNMTDIQSHRGEYNEEETGYEFPAKRHHKALWVIHSIAANMSITVTFLYWFLFGSFVEPNGVGFAFDLSIHTLNCLFMLLDLALSSIPIRFLHVVYPMVFGVCYGISTVIYWAVERRALYGLLDYGNAPGLAIGLLVGVIFVLVPLIQLLMFGLYRLRLLVVKKYKS